MPKRIDLTGKQFGRLTVIEQNGRSKHGYILWKCECDCGNSTNVPSSYLLKGETTSCGCYWKSLFTKHGKANSKIYAVWEMMKQRCFNPNNKDYKYYGDRGIKVCEEWKNNFDAFYKWSNENGYKKGLTIDRINNDKDYSPDNCRWVTMKIQSKNKRKSS